jgi:hypothetical protein
MLTTSVSSAAASATGHDGAVLRCIVTTRRHMSLAVRRCVRADVATTAASPHLRHEQRHAQCVTCIPEHEEHIEDVVIISATEVNRGPQRHEQLVEGDQSGHHTREARRGGGHAQDGPQPERVDDAVEIGCRKQVSEYEGGRWVSNLYTKISHYTEPDFCG